MQENVDEVYLPTKLLSDFGCDNIGCYGVKRQREIMERYFLKIFLVYGKRSPRLVKNTMMFWIIILIFFILSCRLGLLSAANIYHAIEDEIRNDHYDCVTKRQYTSRFKRLSIINDMKKRLQKISKS